MKKEEKKKRNVFREMCEQIRGILDKLNEEKDETDDLEENVLFSFSGESTEATELEKSDQPTEAAEHTEPENSDESTYQTEAERSSEKEASGESGLQELPEENEESEEKEDRKEKEVNKNPDKKGLDKIREELSAADESGIAEMLEMLAEDISRGELSKESLEVLRHARDYEGDIEKALASGEIKGRNAQIEMKVLDDYGTDVLPHPQSRNSNFFGGSRRESIFDLARTAL